MGGIHFHAEIESNSLMGAGWMCELQQYKQLNRDPRLVQHDNGAQPFCFRA